jgi:hypothetical protein
MKNRLARVPGPLQRRAMRGGAGPAGAGNPRAAAMARSTPTRRAKGFQPHLSPTLTRVPSQGLHAFEHSAATRSIRVALSFANPKLENAMGKYVFAWILGVPAVVLVIIYFLAH